MTNKEAGKREKEKCKFMYVNKKGNGNKLNGLLRQGHNEQKNIRYLGVSDNTILHSKKNYGIKLSY